MGGYVTVEAKRRWNTAADRHGVTVSALLEVMSRYLLEDDIDMAQVVEEARQVDTDNRRRRHTEDEDGGA